MKRYLVGIVLVAVIAFRSTVVQAGVIDLWCYIYNDPLQSTHSCNFDYDLQQLVIADTIYVLDPPGGVGLWGSVDSDSTFSVTRTITNNTGVAWTGYELRCTPTISPGYAEIVRDTIESTHLQTMTFPDRWTAEFSGSPPVLTGESFTIQFDMHAPGPEFDDVLYQKFIPEAATIALLGLGALHLVKRQRPRVA